MLSTRGETVYTKVPIHVYISLSILNIDNEAKRKSFMANDKICILVQNDLFTDTRVELAS
jgi:hypothetical protein